MKLQLFNRKIASTSNFQTKTANISFWLTTTGIIGLSLIWGLGVSLFPIDDLLKGFIFPIIFAIIWSIAYVFDNYRNEFYRKILFKYPRTAVNQLNLFVSIALVAILFLFSSKEIASGLVESFTIRLMTVSVIMVLSFLQLWLISFSLNVVLRKELGEDFESRKGGQYFSAYIYTTLFTLALAYLISGNENTLFTVFLISLIVYTFHYIYHIRFQNRIMEFVHPHAFEHTDREKHWVSHHVEPFRFEKNWKSWCDKYLEDRKEILEQVAQIPLIDQIDALRDCRNNLRNLGEKDSAFLEKTINSLETTNAKLESIDNVFEFSENNRDRFLLKALIRRQMQQGHHAFIQKMLNENRTDLKKSAIIASGYLEDIHSLPLLVENLTHPSLTVAARNTLVRLGDFAWRFVEIEFQRKKDDLQVAEAIVNIAGRVNSKRTQAFLFELLEEKNLNIAILACHEIIKQELWPTEPQVKKVEALLDKLIPINIQLLKARNELQMEDQSVRHLSQMLSIEWEDNIALIKGLLKTIYRKQQFIEVIFDYFESYSWEKKFIGLSLTEKTLPLSLSKKLKALYFPESAFDLILEEYPQIKFEQKFKDNEEILMRLLQVDYDQISTSLRAAIAYSLIYIQPKELPNSIIGDFFGEDPLLSQTAAEVIYKTNLELYIIFLRRLDTKKAKSIDYLVTSNLNPRRKIIHENNLSKYQKLLFLNSLPYLNHLSLRELNIFERFFVVKFLPIDNSAIPFKQLEDAYWLVEEGSFHFSLDGIENEHCYKRDILDMTRPIDHENLYIKAKNNLRFLRADRAFWEYLMRNTHYNWQQNVKSPQSLVKATI